MRERSTVEGKDLRWSLSSQDFGRGLVRSLTTGLALALQRMAEPPWKRRCLEKRARREAHLPPAWCLNAASLPASHQLDVSTVPLRSGKLTARELEITGIDEADMLLARLSDATFSAIEVATAFCKRATLAQQLVRISLLTSARACDDAAKTNCLTEVLFESALEQAKQLDHHLAHTGQTVGPLHGLPVSLKDQCQIKGVECCMGFASWLGDISDEDAVLVQILRKAGAVFYVRSNVPQTLLSAECDNHVFGRTCNPFNRSLSCGGSSGGEGALLGFGASIVGVGTDIGGSIRIPASYQGLYGLRPTTRRLPYYGLRNYLHGLEAIESSVGPMARTPGSCATFMRAVLHGEPHTSDPTVVELPWREELYRLPGRREKLSFGMLTCDDVVRPHPPILRALAMTRRALEAMGHEVFDWVPPVDHYELIQINTEIIFAVRRPLGQWQVEADEVRAGRPARLGCYHQGKQRGALVSA